LDLLHRRKCRKVLCHKCHTVTVSHDRCGKEVHRPYSSCISSIEKSNGNSIEFSLSNADKEAVGLIPALELASLTTNMGSGVVCEGSSYRRACLAAV